MTTNKKKYVAYYRVSTQQQGRSGLGLEAQQSAVKQFVKDADLIAEYTEIESGKYSSRQQLRAALELCKAHQAILIVAKLDRLSRNIHFITSLMESKVKFICCDLPEATDITIHIFAAVAQQERKLISERTIAAHAAARERGVKFGNPKADKAFMDMIRAKRKPKQYDKTLIYILQTEKAKGSTFEQIATRLNEHNLKPARSGQYTAAKVFKIWTKIEETIHL